MNKNYCILGVKRSGNHAIINWLKPQLSNVIRFYNDHPYFSTNLTIDFEEHYLVETVLRLQNCRLFVDGINLRNGKTFEKTYKDSDNIISFEEVKLNKILQNEDKWINYFNRGLKTYNENIKITNNNEYIIIIRNPWNIIASHIKWKIRMPLYKRKLKVINVWNDFYQQYIEQKQTNVHFIIYDKWFSDIEYRKSISKELNLNFNDININKVAGMAGGSSFDKLTFDGKAQNMNVLNRYKQMINHKQMAAFIMTEEAIDLKNKWNHVCDLGNMIELKIN